MNPFIIVTPVLRATIIMALQDRLDLLEAWLHDLGHDYSNDEEYINRTIGEVTDALAQARRGE